MGEDSFRLPGSSYTELVKIIRAYGQTTGPVSPDEVTHLCGIHPTQISRNNAFLVSMGVIDQGKKKSVTERGKSLALALEHEMPDEIRARCTAGQSKTPYVMAGAGALVDILKAAELVKEADGKVNVVSESEESLTIPIQFDPSGTYTAKVAGLTGQTDVRPSIVATRAPSSGAPPFQVQIRVNVQCTVAELANLSTSLRKLLNELSAAPGEAKKE